MVRFQNSNKPKIEETEKSGCLLCTTARPCIKPYIIRFAERVCFELGTEYRGRHSNIYILYEYELILSLW